MDNEPYYPTQVESIEKCFSRNKAVLGKYQATNKNYLPAYRNNSLLEKIGDYRAIDYLENIPAAQLQQMSLLPGLRDAQFL